MTIVTISDPKRRGEITECRAEGRLDVDGSSWHFSAYVGTFYGTDTYGAVVFGNGEPLRWHLEESRIRKGKGVKKPFYISDRAWKQLKKSAKETLNIMKAKVEAYEWNQSASA